MNGVNVQASLWSVLSTKPLIFMGHSFILYFKPNLVLEQLVGPNWNDWNLWFGWNYPCVLCFRISFKLSVPALGKIGVSVRLGSQTPAVGFRDDKVTLVYQFSDQQSSPGRFWSPAWLSALLKSLLHQSLILTMGNKLHLGMNFIQELESGSIWEWV